MYLQINNSRGFYIAAARCETGFETKLRDNEEQCSNKSPDRAIEGRCCRQCSRVTSRPPIAAVNNSYFSLLAEQDFNHRTEAVNIGAEFIVDTRIEVGYMRFAKNFRVIISRTHGHHLGDPVIDA